MKFFKTRKVWNRVARVDRDDESFNMNWFKKNENEIEIQNVDQDVTF